MEKLISERDTVSKSPFQKNRNDKFETVFVSKKWFQKNWNSKFETTLTLDLKNKNSENNVQWYFILEKYGLILKEETLAKAVNSAELWIYELTKKT